MCIAPLTPPPRQKDMDGSLDGMRVYVFAHGVYMDKGWMRDGSFGATDEEREVEKKKILSTFVHIPLRVLHFLGSSGLACYRSCVPLLQKHLHVFRWLLFSPIPDCVNTTACKHNDESVTHSTP